MARPLLFFSVIFILINCLTVKLNAQAEVDERAMISFDRGLGFHAPDSNFGLNLRFRMQNRMGITGFSGEEPVLDRFDARIRRLRLRFDGYTSNDRITYYLQLSFSRSDQDWDASGVPNIVRDAMVYYEFSDKFYVGFGQGKLPGNRQRINSSGQLQFTDRSDVNAIYNIDRDFGLMGYYSSNISFLHYNIKTAISSGEGRNALASDNGLAYTGRIELMPFGRFKGDGDFSEGDLEREPTLRLSLAGGYSFNHKAVRIQGQRGQPLYQARDIKSLYFDALMKYRGWGAYAEYMDRNAGIPLTFSSDGDYSYVRTGHGMNFQLSYVFPNYIELAGRYTHVNPEKVYFDSGLTSGIQGDNILISNPGTDELTMGITKYLARHKIKAQCNIGYMVTENLSHTANPITNWILTFQIELGI